MEKCGFVYIWFDRKHKRYYVGCHWGSEDDGYVCSSTWMMQAYKHRPKDFKRRIIARIYTNRMDMFLEEQRWLSMISPKELKVRYYNLNITWQHWQIDPDKEKATKEKISIKTKEAMQRPEVREKYLKGLDNRNTRSSEVEVREKRRQSMIGKNVGKDTSKAVAAAAERNKGKHLSQEHKKKLSEKSYFKMAECVYCKTVGNVATIGRYHNAKCKKEINSK